MKFKMLSIKELTDRMRETAGRFPLLVFFLCVGAVNHLYMSFDGTESFKYFSRNIFMSLLVLIPVLYSIKSLYESRLLGKKARFAIEMVSIIAAALYFYYLPKQTLITFYLSQFSILFISSILLCLVCIKQGIGDDNFYWDFHAVLFIRLIITGIYTLIILGGTSAALGATDSLFKTDLFKHHEIRILIVTLWLFAPLFFLSGVPNLSTEEKVINYRPKWLENIGLYIMIPLTIVYLGILYAYGVKILFQWQLPEGTVSYLVLSFAAFGIVSLLIIFPFQKDKNSKWCYWFSKYFYFLQIPLLLLLFDAIFTRVFAYGITFRRYYLLALAIWLLFLSVFMVIRKNRSIIVIPFSLLVIGVLSIFGPWSSFNISYINQRERLLKILSSNHLIQNGKVITAKQILPHEVCADISSITKYLYDYGKLQNLSDLIPSQKALTPESFAKEIGFKYVERWNYGRDHFYYQWCNKTLVFPASKYQLFVRFRDNFYSKDREIKRIESGGVSIEFFPEYATFQFSGRKSQKSQIKLEQAAKYFKTESNTSNEGNCNYRFEDEFFEINCLFDTLSGWEDQSGTHFSSVHVDFLIREK